MHSYGIKPYELDGYQEAKELIREFQKGEREAQSSNQNNKNDKK